MSQCSALYRCDISANGCPERRDDERRFPEGADGDQNFS